MVIAGIHPPFIVFAFLRVLRAFVVRSIRGEI